MAKIMMMRRTSESHLLGHVWQWQLTQFALPLWSLALDIDPPPVIGTALYLLFIFFCISFLPACCLCARSVIDSVFPISQPVGTMLNGTDSLVIPFISLSLLSTTEIGPVMVCVHSFLPFFFLSIANGFFPAQQYCRPSTSHVVSDAVSPPSTALSQCPWP